MTKTICDFGGLDGATHKDDQPMAAVAATDFADWPLRQPIMDLFLQHMVATSRPCFSGDATSRKQRRSSEDAFSSLDASLA